MTEEVRIADRAGTDGTIHGLVSQDCMINGPVVLVPVGQQNRFVDCEVPWTQTDYIGSPNQFWGVPPRAGQYQLVFLVDCTFRRCRFDQTVDLRAGRECKVTHGG
jgi:hypothetical protein